MIEHFWRWLKSPQALTSAVIVVLAIVLWKTVRRLYKKYIQVGNSKGERTTLVRVLFSTARFLIVGGAGLVILEVNGVNVTSLVAGLGLLSAIVGLALQDFLKDVIMGIHIITDHFFSVGDVVRYGDIEGVVIGFTMKTTRLRNIYDQTITTVCNRNISEITKMPQQMMVDLDLPLPYEEDCRRIHAVLQGVSRQIGELPGIIRCEYKGTQDFADSAVIYKIRFYCLPEEMPERRRNALCVVQERLADENISIPYNQLDVHQIREH